MARITIGIGVLLCALGAISYFIIAEQSSITALIPAFFGIALLILGLIALAPARRALAMHIAVAIALLGFLGSPARPIMQTLRGEAVDWGSPAVMVALSTAAICLVFLILCIRSFLSARRAAPPEAR